MERMTAIGDQSFDNQKSEWFVNSVFEQTFNLTDLKNPAMICFAKINQKIVPGGVYLAANEFTKLQAALPAMKGITTVKEGLLFQSATKKWLVTIKPELNTQIAVNSSKLLHVAEFIDCCQKLDLVTGFSYPLAYFCQKKTNPYYQMMNDFSADDQIQKTVDYLIGRGRGLTPSGDDFLLGWLLIAILNGQAPYLKQAIEKRVKNRLFTTDVSRNYLARGVNGEFSQALLAVANYLTTEIPTGKPDVLIQKVVDYGSTSGVDSLAGIISGLLLNKH